MYPQVFGKYVLERELARGGMARVVLATLRGAGGFEKRLVVKQIRDELACDDEFVRRFVEEAKTTVALAHPNIVPVYELGVELGTYFLAMEWVDGVSTAELLRASAGSDGGPSKLSPEEGAYVGVEVCRALDYAHRRMNVVHRDVTPRNVMVDEEGQVKVIDFGIAAPAAAAAGVFGSPGHMPPEQMEGRELAASADVFAVAVLLMELWSGRAPFRRRTNEEIEAAMKAPHPRASDADIRLLPLDDVIASALSLDPRARPQQAEDLGRVFRKFLAGIDLGDVARQLGDRVREARAKPVPAAPPSAVLARPPSRPTATQMGTKTFAARAEVEAIAPARADRPADTHASNQPSTRRLASGAAPGPLEGAAGERAARVREDAAPDVHPIETPARAPASIAAKGTRRAALVGALGAGVLAVGAFLAGRGTGQPSAGRATQAVQAVSSAERLEQGGEEPLASAGPSFVAARAQTAASAAAQGTPPAATAHAAEEAAPAAAARATEGTASSAAVEPAQIVLLGEGTTVRVDGVARGAAPARVSLEPGLHTVLFAFPATGESKSESLALGAGEHATLRADFTGVAPAIRVERSR